MKKISLLVIMVLFVTAGSALAEGPYVGANIGLGINHDSDATGGVTIEYKKGLAFDLAVGYQFNENVRAEGEFGYRSADVDNVKSSGFSTPVTDADLTVMSYMANGYYDITQFKSPVTPFVGAGLGMLDGKFKSPGYSKSDTTIGYQLMLGASYEINKQVSADASYRFQGAVSDFKIDGDKISYTNSSFLVGIRYKF